MSKGKKKCTLTQARTEEVVIGDDRERKKHWLREDPELQVNDCRVTNALGH